MLLNACSSHNVFFFKTEPDINLYKENTIKLYIDAQGDLYPKTWLNKVYTPKKSISGYIYEQSGRDASKTKLCPDLNPTPENDAYLLCQAVINEPCFKSVKRINCQPNKQWISAQSQLWKNAASDIFIKAENRTNKDLVFLIHGFNSTQDKSIKTFSEMKDEISLASTKLPLFIEIYWDGFIGSSVINSWKKAQYSGPLVGFNLRQLFKEIKNNYNNDDKLPNIRVLTHSSGAFVAGALFGNPYIVLPCLHHSSKCGDSSKYDTFRQYREGNNMYPIPDFTDISLAMIAAATPTTTFSGGKTCDKNFDFNAKGGILSKNTRLIFTLNPEDEILTKYINLTDHFGATGAGVSKTGYCKNIANLKNKDFDTYAIEFNNKKHGVSYYFKNKKSTNDFINLFLGKKVQDQKLCQ